MQIEVNGASLFFDVVGPRLTVTEAGLEERETLLVLHGGPGADHTTLRPFFDRFSDTYQLVYLDHRGCGRSTGSIESWTLDQWADDIAGFLDALGIEKPLVFGQSFGGMVAMHYGARHPDGPAKLILSSTAARMHVDVTLEMNRTLGGEAAVEVARAFLTEPRAETFEAYMATCMPLYSRSADASRKVQILKPEVTIHFFQNELLAMDLRPELKAITCPTLVMGGAADPVTPVICSEELQAAIGGNAVLEIFEGCGHGVFRDDEAGAERVLRAFMAS